VKTEAKNTSSTLTFYISLVTRFLFPLSSRLMFSLAILVLSLTMSVIFLYFYIGNFSDRPTVDEQHLHIDMLKQGMNKTYRKS